MASDAGCGFEYERWGKRAREQEDEKFQGVTGGVMPPETWVGSDHGRRKKRHREHEGSEVVGNGENSNSLCQSV